MHVVAKIGSYTNVYLVDEASLWLLSILSQTRDEFFIGNDSEGLPERQEIENGSS